LSRRFVNTDGSLQRPCFALENVGKMVRIRNQKRSNRSLVKKPNNNVNPENLSSSRKTPFTETLFHIVSRQTEEVILKIPLRWKASVNGENCIEQQA